ncbi:MAG: TolC family protein [Desulfobacteraceae bacterium]|nr:TolC family protein [Desulfobacteraceae bacterium]MBC2755454.1 TolC family protein [Desulfobacteraceae bacterium]
MKESQLVIMTGKRMQKIILFLMILIIPAALNAGEADKEPTERSVYSLADLYRLGLERSESIKIAENQLYVAEKDVDRAFSVLVPTISAYGDYIRYDAASVIQPKSGHEYGVKLQQQFTINGREFIVLGAAKDTIKQREYDLDAVREENLFTVASAYYDIVNKRKRVEILKENVKRLEAHKEAVIIQLKLEEVPKTALLRTEAELSGSKSDLVKAENTLVFAYATLARMLEIPLAYEIITPDLDDDSPIDGHLEKFIETAFDQRSDIKSLEMNVKLAGDNVDILKSEYWPTLSFEAGYKRQGSDPSYLSEDETVYGAVNLNMILFDWGFRSASISQEKANKRSAELLLQAKSKEIALEVEQAYLMIITAQSVIVALKDKLRFSRADYEAVSLQFKVGQADSLDIMDSNTVLLNSERELSEARYLLALAKIGLESAQGIFLKSVTNRLNN